MAKSSARTLRMSLAAFAVATLWGLVEFLALQRSRFAERHRA